MLLPYLLNIVVRTFVSPGLAGQDRIHGIRQDISARNTSCANSSGARFSYKVLQER